MNLLPQPTDWTEPKECGFYELAGVLADAYRAGFFAFRMDVQPHGYRLTFQRKPARQIWKEIEE